MDPTIAIVALLVAFAIFYAIYRSYTRISIAHIPGPEPESFLLGNLPELFQGQAGEADFKWQEVYGDIVRIKATFGEDRLLVSDPKALQYIYQTSGYNFHKQQDRRELSRIIFGRGIVWADGNDHKRHRKVMLPAFGRPESRAFLPLFCGYAAQLTTKWKDIIGVNMEQAAVLDISSWVSRATLDAIGEAAFDYQIGAMENAGSPLRNAFVNLLADTFGSPSKTAIFLQSVSQYIPRYILELLGDHAPSSNLNHARSTGRLATHFAKSLVASKTEALLRGEGERDIMSLLVKANASEDGKTRLNEEEIHAQMRTIILAGHETTANSLCWTLLELSKHPEIQHKLRAEIRAKEKEVHVRRDLDFSLADFEGMPYTLAVIKEALRFHPVSYNNYRQAGKDDVLPLSKSITTTSGKVITEIPIPKGLKVITSIAGYNRNKNVFGENAHTFDPERWLNGAKAKSTASVGVYGNLLTFAGGVRSCIGWRFAILELQAFLVELVNNFEFSLTPEAQRIRREACVVMVPTIEGQVEKGAQLPLRVCIASRED